MPNSDKPLANLFELPSLSTRTRSSKIQAWCEVTSTEMVWWTTDTYLMAGAIQDGNTQFDLNGDQQTDLQDQNELVTRILNSREGDNIVRFADRFVFPVMTSR